MQIIATARASSSGKVTRLETQASVFGFDEILATTVLGFFPVHLPQGGTVFIASAMMQKRGEEQ